MNLLAMLLPRFISETPPMVRRIIYGALVLVGALLLLDYKFAAGSGISWVDSHVVTAAVLAWYVLVVTPVLTMAHQKVDLPKWEEDVWDAITPELTQAAAPAADVPNAQAEATIASAPPAVAPSTPPQT